MVSNLKWAPARVGMQTHPNTTNSNLFSNHTFSESRLCSPKEICLAWGWKSRFESLHDDNGINVGLLVLWVHLICEAAGHKIMFWSFYVKATWAEVLKASISRIPTGWKSLHCKAAQNNQHQHYSSSINGQHWPASAGSVLAPAQRRPRPHLGGGGHKGDPNVTGICERRLIWERCPSARETVRGQWVCNIFKLAFISASAPFWTSHENG